MRVIPYFGFLLKENEKREKTFQLRKDCVRKWSSEIHYQLEFGVPQFNVTASFCTLGKVKVGLSKCFEVGVRLCKSRGLGKVH